MKHELRLKTGERWDVTAKGQYIGYVSGAGEIEILIDGEPHYLDVNESYQSNEIFQNFTVRNTSDLTGDFVIKTGLGKLYMAGDGQLTEVLGIRETVKTEVLNADEINDPIVSEITNLINTVLSTKEQAASSLNNFDKTFAQNEVYEISSNVTRRDLSVFTDEVNVGVITIEGRPLEAGKLMEFKNFTGSVNAIADTANDKIHVLEVIK